MQSGSHSVRSETERPEVRTDRRRYPRVSEKDAILVTVLDADDARLVGEVLQCSSEDIALSGLRLLVPMPLQEGILLKLRVVFSDPATELPLVGRVVWCKSDSRRKRHTIGVELDTSRRQAYAKWAAILKDKVASGARLADF